MLSVIKILRELNLGTLVDRLDAEKIDPYNVISASDSELLGDSRDQNHAHVYFFFFPWLALYVALDYVIHRWPLLEKMRKTLSVAILVAMKVLVLVDNVCACEKGDLVKPRFWKRAWIFLRRERNYFNNKCSDPTILF